MDKAALRRAILAQLEAELATLTTAAHDAHAEATDEENRAEDKYDMRSQSAAYLAAGQAKLATELGEAIGAYRQQLEREVLTREVFRDCRSGPAAVGLLAYRASARTGAGSQGGQRRHQCLPVQP